VLLFENIKDFQAFFAEKKEKVGFVPTMGALHQGHLSLINKAKTENEIVVASIFVNPLQFNDKVDLEKYPKKIQKDKELLESEDCDVLFLPNNKIFYPTEPILKFDFGALEAVMEGANRPGHFNGVAIVVSKLFNIVKPNRAYFGQKDWQQFIIIKQLVEDLSFDIELVPCPIIREKNGLAMSSRNQRLNTQEKIQASALFQSLQRAKEKYEQNISLKKIKNELIEFFKNTKGVDLEYFEIVNAYSLQNLQEEERTKKVVFCIAAKVGEVRLIDNILVN